MSDLLPSGIVFTPPKAYYFGNTTTEGFHVTFGEKLRQLREAAGMTQEKLARAIDMSLSIVRDYEQGRKEPSLRSAFKLADALGVDCRVFRDCMGPSAVETPPAKKTRKGKGK